MNFQYLNAPNSLFFSPQNENLCLFVNFISFAFLAVRLIFFCTILLCGTVLIKEFVFKESDADFCLFLHQLFDYFHWNNTEKWLKTFQYDHIYIKRWQELQNNLKHLRIISKIKVVWFLCCSVYNTKVLSVTRRWRTTIKALFCKSFKLIFIHLYQTIQQNSIKSYIKLCKKLSINVK